MSAKESWRTRKYWQSIGGLLIEEFVAVSKSENSARRLIDGVIVLNERNQIHPNHNYDISGKDVVVIQTKAGKLGMYLLGQVYFSKLLMEKLNPRSVKMVAICGKSDDVMEKLASTHNIEIVVINDIERK
jgi:hypothetical protein